MDNVIISKCSLYTFELPLIKPLRINNTDIHSRLGAIIALSAENGVTGFGEISPLPGLHKESLSEIITYLEKTVDQLKSPINLPLDNFMAALSLNKSIEWIAWPCLRFGLTSAILDLKSRVEKRPAYQFWDPQNTGDYVLVNALLTRQDDPETNKGFLTTHNFRVVKIKVGSADIGSEIKKVKDLSSVLTDKVSIRLDANRSWNYQQAVQFLDGIKGLPVEYIEEPLIDLDELGRLISEQNCPVAIDESLPAWQDRGNIPAGLVAIVIKPAVIGSIDENMQWINYARQRNIKAVISDTFHSGIGMIMHINLAVYAGGNHTAMGLDTYRWLEHDLLTTPLPLPSGILATRALLAKNVSPEFTSIKKVF